MDIFEKEIEELKTHDMFRHVYDIDKKEGKYIFLDGKRYLNLSSNDYLCLSADKSLVSEFVSTCSGSSEFLFSSASARLLSGSSEIYKTLERRLAGMFSKEAALLFNTGYQCNLGVVSAFAQKNDVIFCDKLNHASIIDGIKLSGADFYRYRHLDYEHLDELLEKHRADYRRALIVSESVFSMDGDIADIRKLVELKKKYDAVLMIDEAHAFGVFGDNLCGVSEEEGVLKEVDIISATLGKSMASMGAFVVADKSTVDYFVNKSRSFIFSTALPSVNILWTNWLLNDKFDLLLQKKERIRYIIKFALDYLKDRGIDSVSSSQIIPVVTGDNKRALELALFLQERGFFVLPIRPPSVAPKSSRIRLSLNADIGMEEIKEIIDLVSGELR